MSGNRLHRSCRFTVDLLLRWRYQFEVLNRHGGFSYPQLCWLWAKFITAVALTQLYGKIFFSKESPSNVGTVWHQRQHSHHQAAFLDLSYCDGNKVMAHRPARDLLSEVLELLIWSLDQGERGVMKKEGGYLIGFLSVGIWEAEKAYVVALGHVCRTGQAP